MPLSWARVRDRDNAGEPESHAPSPDEPTRVAPGRRRQSAEACRRSLCGRVLRGTAGRLAGRASRTAETNATGAGAAGGWRVTRSLRETFVRSIEQATVTCVAGPWAAGRLVGAFGELARRARPIPAAPGALATGVGLAVPSEHLLGVAPQQ